MPSVVPGLSRERSGDLAQEILRVIEPALETFGTTTRSLPALRDWLAGFGVTVLGMESTGVYWKPVYALLEDEVEPWLLNAHHLKAVPGRKSDVKDAEWICQLVEHDLVRASFVPPRDIRELRDLTRYRKALIQERTREVQRLDKVPQDACIKPARWPRTCSGAPGA